MENYEEIVIKTVRDLFRCYPLVQIKKYMMNKEGEISDKDNELKSLILKKYTSLTNGIEGLEKISLNLNSLENIRAEFSKKINEIDFEQIENSLKNITFNNDFLDNLNSNKTINFEERNEKIEEFFQNKNFAEIINEMILIKDYINSDNFKDMDIKEKYYFYLVDLIEDIMSKMIEDNDLCNNIKIYKILFDDIFLKLINDKYDESMEYLIMSELYLKILYDKNIKRIIEEYFHFFNENNQDSFSINILLKILFLRISQILYDISNISIELLFSDKLINKYYTIYQIMECIKLICDTYLINDNNKTINLNKFYNFIKSEIDKNINSLLIIPRNMLKILNLHKSIKFWNKFLKNENNLIYIDNKNLLEFLFLDKSIEQISNIASYTLNQYSINNLFNLKIILKNKNIKNENDIYLAISNLKKIKNDKLYKTIFISVIEDKLYKYLSELNANLNKDNFTKENEIRIEYMNIIIKIFSYEELIHIFKELNYNNILKVINELIEKNQLRDYEKIKLYIYDSFKLQLLFELYRNEEQKNKYKLFSITDSLRELIELLFEFEITEKKHKINIFLNIVDVYNSIFNHYFSQKENKLFNNIIINNTFILKNLNLEESKGREITNLVEKINDFIKIDVNNLNENISNYKEIELLNKYFCMDEYIKNKNNLIFDLKIQNNNQIKIEYLPIYVNKMNVFMLNKIKIDYSERGNNCLSTCNIYDYRIEENYLSIKQDKGKISENMDVTNSNKNESNNMFGNLTGKLFNFINDD